MDFENMNNWAIFAVCVGAYPVIALGNFLGELTKCFRQKRREREEENRVNRLQRIRTHHHN